MQHATRTLLLFCLTFIVCGHAFAAPQNTTGRYNNGLYITQNTLSHSKLLQKIVSKATYYHLHSLVVDLERPTTAYQKGIRYIHQHNLQAVTRVVIFPKGGTYQQVQDRHAWEKRWELMDYAIQSHTDAIQLDYIRYNKNTPPSWHNVLDVATVVHFFKQKIAGRVPLEIDVFGETALTPSLTIGQDVKTLAHEVQVICPMLYPSHFNYPSYLPENAYSTIYKSLQGMKKQLGENKTHIKIIAYIEAYNYRFPHMAWAQRVHYIQQEIRAVRDAHVDGWYVWSANNYYKALFEALDSTPRLQTTPTKNKINTVTKDSQQSTYTSQISTQEHQPPQSHEISNYHINACPLCEHLLELGSSPLQHT